MNAVNTAELLDLLKMIVAEVSGPEKPYSTDSYLPPHMVEAAKAAIAKAEAGAT